VTSQLNNCIKFHNWRMQALSAYAGYESGLAADYALIVLAF